MYNVDLISIDFYCFFIGGVVIDLYDYLIKVIGLENKDKFYEEYYFISIILLMIDMIKLLMVFLK